MFWVLLPVFFTFKRKNYAMRSLTSSARLTLAVLILFGLTSCGGGTSVNSSSTSFSGTAMDGYLYKANVFLDLNENGTFDTVEPTATTSETGGFTLSATQAQINTYKVVVVAVAGVTIDQDSPNTTVTAGFTMMSPPGNHEVVSPLTTQVVAKMSSGLSLDAAKTAVQTELGLDSIDVMKNYVAAKATDANYAKAHNVAASIAEVLKTVDADSSSSNLAEKLASLASKVTTQIKPNIDTIKSASSTTNAVTVAAIPKSAKTTSIDYGTPANFAAAIDRSFTGNMVLASTVINRSRYMISDAASASSAAKYLSMGTRDSLAFGYSAESATLPTSTTYNSYLSKLFLLVAQGTTGYHRIDSHFHPNNSLDVDTTDGHKLKFRNNFGKASTPLHGYLTFAYNSTTKLLQAKKRYQYSYTTVVSGGTSTYTPSWTEEANFSAADFYVNHTNGVYTLVSTAEAATPLHFYDSPINLGIPTFMNPKSVAFVDNGPAPFMSKVTTSQMEGTSGSIYRSVNDTYKAQVATAGTDASTKTAASTMLASIKTTVENSGGKLRYAPAVYTAYRDAALATKLVSDSIADGTPGQNLVPYVYFTNEADSNGFYHPFMVVVSYGNQASPNGLVDVPHPPGDGSGSYPNSKVTRFSNLENYVQMIPMRDYGQVTAVTDNSSVVIKNLWTERKISTLEANVYTYADEANNGILIDGSVMFPAYNNVLEPSHLAGELSASGCHVGQGGGGPHCHSDGYQSGFGLALYNDSDYSNRTHPPLIGFGYDGIALFGKYRDTTDALMLGYTSKLDEFGAHNHDSVGYHYHAHTVIDHTPVGQTYTATMYVLMKGAYIGKVTTVPYFRAKNTFSTNKYLGGTVQ
jgi:hypothetical protein